MAFRAASYYLFDFDDNVMCLGTSIFLRNSVTGRERAVSTREFAEIQPLLGRPGPWADFAVSEESFRDFCDLPPGRRRGKKQPFVADVERAVACGGTRWQGPSWDVFAYACKHQRPVSIITARSHSPGTLKAGMRVLVDKKLIAREPIYHTVYPVGNPEVRCELQHEMAKVTRRGGKRVTAAEINKMTTPQLKHLAILCTVEQALRRDGTGRQVAHHFGMSDDDPENVHRIIGAMAECKKRHPDSRFFVINTHWQEEVKLEILEIGKPAPRWLAPGQRADYLS